MSDSSTPLSWSARITSTPVVTTAIGMVALFVVWLDRLHRLPWLLGPIAASVFAVVVAYSLAERTGGRSMLPAVLATGYGVVAVATGWQPLLCGAAVATGVLSALLAIMVTTPAATYGGALREVLFAFVVATSGGIAVAGFHAVIKPHQFEYVALALTLLSAFGLVYRLGAGLHGLGRRGYVAAAATALSIGFALAYSAALSKWGSHHLTDMFSTAQDWATTHLIAVPHPVDTLVGVPALCWGVFMRARRRQGWWVCAFGAAMTAPAATRFLGHFPLKEGLVGAAYTLIIGLAFGYLLIRAEQSMTGSRGRRARRSEEAAAHRPEPPRLRALR